MSGGFRRSSRCEKILDAIDPRFRLAVLLASFCGLRKSESQFARRHFLLDEAHPVIVVERQRAEVVGKGLVFAELETKAAYRTVAIPATVRAEVDQHLERFVDDDPEALLFTIERTDDTPRATTWQYKIWGPAREVAGLPELRFHDLRHLAGTLTALAGGTLKEIQSRMGHASPQAAMIYQHVAHGRDSELAQGIDRLITSHNDET